MQQSKTIDYTLFFVVLWLIVFGVIMISSVSVYASHKVTTAMVLKWALEDPHNYFYLLRNVLHTIIWLCALAMIAKIPFYWLERYARNIFLATYILLASTLFFWVAYNWARWWLDIPFLPFSLQPVEFMKLWMILYFSVFIKKKKWQLGDLFDWFFPYLFLLSTIIFLLALQPDFGSILLIVPVAIAMFFIGWWSIRHLLVTIVIGFVFACSIYSIWKNMSGWAGKLSYISQRIDNFLSDNETSIQNQTINFQTKQGLIAIGSGGMFGLGFWKSIQKFGYLPEVQWDFIFSVIAEELWFFGVLILLSTYWIIGYRGLMIAKKTDDIFRKSVAVWVSTWILTQASVNIWVNLNILPLTGVTLPFVSYGWSSLLALLCGIAILLSISRTIMEKNAKTSCMFLQSNSFGRKRIKS
jgi:cell division protein FtsW